MEASPTVIRPDAWVKAGRMCCRQNLIAPCRRVYQGTQWSVHKDGLRYERPGANAKITGSAGNTTMRSIERKTTVCRAKAFKTIGAHGALDTCIVKQGALSTYVLAHRKVGSKAEHDGITDFAVDVDTSSDGLYVQLLAHCGRRNKVRTVFGRISFRSTRAT